MKPFKESVLPHDQLLQHLIFYSYSYFQGFPVYLIDPHFKPLAEMCRQLGNRQDSESCQAFIEAVNSNAFYKDFATRFLPYNYSYLYQRDGLFLSKMGDLIVNIFNVWNIIEVKTSDTDIFTVNADSLNQFNKISPEQRQHVHFLFANTTTGALQMMSLQQLCHPTMDYVELYHHSCTAEQLQQITQNSPIPSANIQLKERKRKKTDRNLDNNSNLFYRFDLPRMYSNTPVPLPEYIHNLILNDGITGTATFGTLINSDMNFKAS